MKCGHDFYMVVELVWKVARYTSAAPIFFAECDNYVDGGVKANNPTAFALTEIQNFLSQYVYNIGACIVSGADPEIL